MDMIHGELSGMNINRYDIQLSGVLATIRGICFVTLELQKVNDIEICISREELKW